jgi:hypothetical protein
MTLLLSKPERNMSEDKKELECLDDSMDLPDAEALGPLQDHTVTIVTRKRKGGRKPVCLYSFCLVMSLTILQIYATSQERKQRNRQAQAAFRERRTEYIKQLEDTIGIHEVNLRNVYSARERAVEECIMLRYKNSLLERILLEKGI